MQLKQHPLSAAFPAMSDEEFTALCDDIEDHGQREPIVIHEDMVLDGWHRYSACLELGRTPQTVPFGDDDPVKYVLSRNLHRRHLTASQRAMAVISCNQWAPANRPKNKQAPGASLLKTNKDLAQEAGTGVRTVVDAKTALKAGIGDAVTQGVMTAKQAAQVVRGTPEKPTAKSSKQREQPHDDGPDADEMAAAEAAERADTEALQKLLQADDKLATAYAEIKRLNAELAVVKQARDGFMNKANELIKNVKRLQAKVDKLERAAA